MQLWQYCLLVTASDLAVTNKRYCQSCILLVLYLIQTSDARKLKLKICRETLHVSGIFCAHHQELSTVHSEIGTFHAGYVTASQQSQVGTEFQPDPARKRSNSLHETYQLPSLQQITHDDGHRRCPKPLEFCDKINFGYLVHLVGCFIRSLSRCTVT